QVSNHVVRRMRGSPSGTTSQMRDRKVRRRGTVYEMNVAPRNTADQAMPATATPAATTTDAVGIPLTESKAKVFAALGDFQEAHKLFDQLAEVLNRIAQGAAGELYRPEMIWTGTSAGFACAALRACR